ncbi:FCD domain-containing protein [Bradyrhizobium sp. Arg237L]|uniref:FCD domain-containing protein n=1 Tax=Bradyrhizobium sp. Arg237L TaxID=3003352 RepID=UPI00249F04B0|nr:FCD domain-containing protein [Bradyrhizobium sp. Arg237L]MDI4234166.1 FCD domain-containing protein [Bradyrhizobium sp. Arg237L]
MGELFHRAVAEASGNGILINAIDQIIGIKTHPRWSVKTSVGFAPSLVQQYSQQHEELLIAIKAGDADAAEAAMRRHIMALALTIGPVIAKRH